MVINMKTTVWMFSSISTAPVTAVTLMMIRLLYVYLNLLPLLPKSEFKMKFYFINLDYVSFEIETPTTTKKTILLCVKKR